MVAVILTRVIKMVGLNMILYIAALQAIPRDYDAAARLEGASGWQIFSGITWPLLGPTTLVILVITTIGSFKVFDHIYLMTGGGPENGTLVLAFYIYEQGFQVLRRGLRLGARDDHVRSRHVPDGRATPAAAEGHLTDMFSRRQLRLISRVCWILALSVAAIPFLFPFLWMISSGLKSAAEIFGSPSIIPRQWQWHNYIDVFTYQPFARQYFNSLYIAVTVTAVTLVLASLAGYALARLRFAGASLVGLFLVSALMVPEEVTIIPNFFLMKRLGLIDSHLPLILLPVFGPHGIVATFLMRQYFMAVPRELEEAGRMDGLSRIGVWWRVAIPMSRPALAAVAIITFLHSWNLFLEPLIFVSSLEKFTLPLALSNFTDPYGVPLWHLQLAATSLAVVPILIVYLIAQRQIVESFALSGVKG